MSDNENSQKEVIQKSDIAMKEDTVANVDGEIEETDVFCLLHKSWKDTVPSIKSQRQNILDQLDNMTAELKLNRNKIQK